MPLPVVCILAGGRGTRLGSVAATVPKALVEVAGAPFLHHQLRLLAGNGAGRVVICVGHLGEVIEESVGDGSGFGMTVTCVHDRSPSTGTAGAIRGALPHLGERFLVLYGDTYLRIDYRDFARVLTESGSPAQMAVLRNNGRWDTSNARVDGPLVAHYDKANPDPAAEWIDYGLGGFRAEVFAGGPGTEPHDLSDVYSALASSGSLRAYEATERFFEIGTPESLSEADEFLRSLRPPRTSEAS